MKKILALSFALLVGAFSVAAYGAPGEWWEVTAKMEMPGMPFAMPAMTTKVCIAKGAANDPHQATQDKDCKMTDVKISGNKTSYKVRCVHDGEVMNGTGEITSTPDSYQGTMRLSGTSDGEAVNMNTTYRGKRIGPACDSSQPGPSMAAAQKQIEQTCETSGRSTKDLVNMADMFLAKESLCPGKSKIVCDAVRKDAGKTQTCTARWSCTTRTFIPATSRSPSHAGWICPPPPNPSARRSTARTTLHWRLTALRK